MWFIGPPIFLLVQKRENCVLYLFKRETSIDLLVYVPGHSERVVKEIKQLSIFKKKNICSEESLKAI